MSPTSRSNRCDNAGFAKWISMRLLPGAVVRQNLTAPNHATLRAHACDHPPNAGVSAQNRCGSYFAKDKRPFNGLVRVSRRIDLLWSPSYATIRSTATPTSTCRTACRTNRTFNGRDGKRSRHACDRCRSRSRVQRETVEVRPSLPQSGSRRHDETHRTRHPRVGATNQCHRRTPPTAVSV